MTMQKLQPINQACVQGETGSKRRGTKEKRISQNPQPLLMPPLEEQESQISDDAEEGLLSEDLIVPKYKIIQPSCRIEGAKEGMFYNTLTLEQKDSLENIVFLSRKNGRVMFPSGDFSGARQCYSYDGIAPEREAVIKETGAEPPAPCCVINDNGQKKIVCPFAIWPDTPAENGSRSPRCKQTINFLCVDEFLSPFFLIFHGASIPTIKNFLGSIYLQKRQAMIQRKELHLRSFSITMKLKLHINDRGKFYLPMFEKVEEIVDPMRIHALHQCFDSLRNRTISETLESESKSETIETETNIPQGT